MRHSQQEMQLEIELYVQIDGCIGTISILMYV